MGTSSYAGMSDNVDRFVCSSRHHGALASVKAAFMVLVAIQSFSARAATTGREDAFIGYSERFSASCRDQLEECKRITHSNGCLTSPYVTRTSCPKSCSVPRCVFLGSLQVMHKGFATLQGTTEYDRRTASSHHGGHLRRHGLGQGGDLMLSSLGIGTYLGDPDQKTDEAVTNAVIQSVMSGWNIIDTASNYRYGHAEVAVGHALDALIAGESYTQFAATYGQDITRDMLFVSTKVGFTDNAISTQLLKAGSMKSSDVVAGMHTMHPAYINASVNASRVRLHLDTIDLVYLHNAGEMQLAVLGKTKFFARLLEAFIALEQMRSLGHIRYYGLATWDSFRRPPADPAHLNLADVVATASKAAAAAGGSAGQARANHGFKFIQLPVSAAMPEAWKEAWQTATPSIPGQAAAAPVTLMKAAQQLGVGVFASGPLLEADLLKRLEGVMGNVATLRNQPSTALKLLQLARGTPGLVSSLVGHKTQANVMQNVQLSKVAPLTESEFKAAWQELEPLLASALKT